MSRVERLKITRNNYDGLKKVADTLPKFAKGNDAVREALNVSSGSWHYLRKSTDYDDFKKLQVRNESPIKPRESIDLGIPKAPEAPMPSDMVVIAMELHQINKTLIRLCEAWENTPAKKSWLK